MLAAMKLGAVIDPGDDPADPRRPARPLRPRPRPPCRHQRRQRRQVRRHPGRLHPHRGRRRRAGLARLRGRLRRAGATSRPTARPGPSDPLLLYFTSGTTAKPKLVLHSHQSYPVGASVDDVLDRAAGPATSISTSRRPAGPSTPGAASSRRGTPGPCVFMLNQPRFNAKALLDAIARCGVTTFCAPPTVWRMLIQEDLEGLEGRAARGRRRRRAAQPRGHRAGRAPPGG